MIQNKRNAFTIVELVVVITILAILWTIWFISFSWYLVSVRDSNRISQLRWIYEWLETIKIKKRLPLPDDYVEVRVDWKVIWYQWYVWKNILDIITYSKEWIDPKTKKYFSYYLTKNRKYFQLMASMEIDPSLVTYLWINNTFAYDYSDMYSGVVWDKLWILTDEFNTPIQEVDSIKSEWYVDLATTNSWTLFISILENWRQYSFSWELLADRLETLSDLDKYWPPKYCPDWFVWARWNAWFNQKWFCVAKYEMWYINEDWAVLNSEDDDFYTFKYDESKKITSMRWKYPIASIDYTEARYACESLWKWYHLIKNSERMSIARDIEFMYENWSSWILWDWFITTWLSDDDSDPRWCHESGDRDYQYKTWEWNPSCNKKRQLKLFDWEIIRDFAWWVWEYVDKWVYEETDLWSWDDYWTSSDLDIDEIQKYWPLINRDKVAWVWWILNMNWDTSSVLQRWWTEWDWDYSWIYALDPETDWTDTHWYLWFRCTKFK